MSRSFIDPHFVPLETSAALSFSGNRLDRLSEERDEETIGKAMAHADARLWGLVKGRVLMRLGDGDGDGDGDAEPRGLLTMDDLAAFSPQLHEAVLLGYDKGAPRLAMPLKLDVDAQDFALPDGWAMIDFRSLAAQALLPDDELGQVAQAGALLAWHASCRFCSYCGGKTQMREAGAKRHCTSCGKDHFPRTDPVVIMLTVRGDQCLLGRSHHFPPGMYSALAGFVEPGETMESAVRRETFEEAGIRIGAVHYHATQPWPFPHTLMIGCYAQALEENIVQDEAELDDCRWFHRDEVRAILNGEGEKNEDGSPKYFMPPKLAIANRLVADWVEGKSGL
ncbi:MAG: NAD(+) diphosphatase [Pseudomonadota bacterium]